MRISGDDNEVSVIPWEDILRVRRKEALQETDWTQVPDSPLTDSKKAEWRIYRQALRDLPANSNPTLTNEGYLDYSSFTWPTEPT